MPAELADCRINLLLLARDASNVIGLTQPETFANQRIEIICIDADCLRPFRRKIVVLSGRWIGRQDNWMKAKTLGRLDVQQTTTAWTAFNQDERSSCH
ncbi:hypothetical protein X770_30595 [Mesorhizobium sp. LSJC269B00]|nr:hypothetical protein X770_30595 [Mesorhizobium sp. LSJC269B00]